MALSSREAQVAQAPQGGEKEELRIDQESKSGIEFKAQQEVPGSVNRGSASNLEISSKANRQKPSS